jgi:hypothetical protein
MEYAYAITAPVTGTTRGESNIFNLLILKIILPDDLWITLWKTGGIKCGYRSAGCFAPRYWQSGGRQECYKV